MDGIEVLNQIEITKNPDWAASLRTILIIVIVIGAIIFIISAITDLELLGIITGILEIVLVLACLGLAFIQEPTGKYEYQVLINEDISMLEFYGKYEIIDQEGKIFTIREKEK